MGDEPTTASTVGADAGALDRLSQALGKAAFGGHPPVERWNPPFCGDLDMRIAADGTWFYLGTPIGRPALVRLFASVLRKDPERFVLVTPVERVGIVVEDAPFQAVEMAVEGGATNRRLAFRTNVDDLVTVSAENPMRFAFDAHDGVKPYVLVRGGLWARLTRALTYDLVELGEEREVGGRAMFGVAVGPDFFEVMPASEMAGR